MECREKVEREATPTACIIDSQSVKSAEKGGPALILRRLPRNVSDAVLPLRIALFAPRFIRRLFSASG